MEKCLKPTNEEAKFLLLHDLQKQYYTNGRIKAKYYMLDDKMDGEYKSWHQNGNMSICCFYKKGVLHGDYTDWYQNGQLWEKRFYIDNKLNGQIKVFYEDGQQQYTVYYKDDLREGEYKEWDEEGLLITHYIYENNEVVKDYPLKKHI